MPETQLLALARPQPGLTSALGVAPADQLHSARGEVTSAFLAGVATADECLVGELGGGPPHDGGCAARVVARRVGIAQIWGDRALDVIRREFAVVRSVRQLAGRLRCHPVYLARTFRRALDIPVSDYLAAFKVGIAFRLLTNTELKICAIPSVAGFGGKATLYRNVHRLTGHAPGYWRHVRQRAEAVERVRLARDDASAGEARIGNAALSRVTAGSTPVRSDRDIRYEGGPGVGEPDLTGPWTVPRAVATLMRPLSMCDPPC